MVEQDRARGRAEAWRPRIAPRAAASRRPALAWPDGLSDFAGRAAERVRAWVTVEVGPGRLVPWLAIAFGCGIAIYFAIDREPAPWAAGLLLAATAAATVLARRRPFAFPLALGAAALAAGLATATIKRAIIAHPVLSAPVWNVDIAGFVEIREERERSDRIVVRIERIAGPRLDETLERVRVSVRKGTAPAVGTFVEFKARLSPPLEPLRPGGYDFARDMYFNRIGASGFVLGRIRVAEMPHAPSLWLRYATVVDGMREAIDQRIRAVLPGDKGAIASAVITGKRDAITPPVNEAMYVSGLAHVLSISGYHMAVVAGMIFFAVRAVFALLPAFSNRRPIKKWAALAALGAAAFYLLLSGAEVATQRSFIMVAIVLIGVMVDRPTLTFRTLTVAALVVLLLTPEAIVHPSFQMSFAATLALVAGYQHGLPWMSGGGKTRLAAKIALWGGREIAGLLLVSLLAGAATIPFIAYHFHRISPYGVIANPAL
jgi:competence protein ComEC